MIQPTIMPAKECVIDGEPVVRMELLKQGRALVVPAGAIITLPSSIRRANVVVISKERVKYIAAPLIEETEQRKPVRFRRKK